KILELIAGEEIETQELLAKRLQENGFRVTQATVSRDIRELSLTKILGENGRPKYAAIDYGGGGSSGMANSYTQVLQSGIVSMTQADNLLVIKTATGMAMAICTVLDALDIHEIVGSIAGDDTIMCAIRSADLVPGVIEKINNIKEQTI
ncbi:MAG: arginine repressor, partial [Eubacterium sp.]|nr:arginine repressor [Eubacterium sp.]